MLPVLLSRRCAHRRTRRWEIAAAADDQRVRLQSRRRRSTSCRTQRRRRQGPADGRLWRRRGGPACSSPKMLEREARAIPRPTPRTRASQSGRRSAQQPPPAAVEHNPEAWQNSGSRSRARRRRRRRPSFVPDTRTSWDPRAARRQRGAQGRRRVACSVCVCSRKVVFWRFFVILGMKFLN